MKELAALGQRIRQIKPWTVVTAVLGALLVGYYLFLGARYWNATQQGPELDGQVQNLLRTTRGALPDERSLAAQLEKQELDQQVLYSLFNYPETDELIAVTSATAQETGIALLSVAIDDADVEVIRDIEYHLQPITVTLQGQTEDMYRFLSALYEKVPVLVITGIRIGELDTTPSAQVQMLAYLIPEKAASGAGAGSMQESTGSEGPAGADSQEAD